jgi:hypothetical protein
VAGRADPDWLVSCRVWGDVMLSGSGGLSEPLSLRLTMAGLAQEMGMDVNPDQVEDTINGYDTIRHVTLGEATACCEARWCFAALMMHGFCDAAPSELMCIISGSRPR